MGVWHFSAPMPCCPLFQTRPAMHGGRSWRFTGELVPFLVTFLTSFVLLFIVIGLLSGRFGALALKASGASFGHKIQSKARYRFSKASPARTLRQKEWLLLRRDPWLVSQSLMQIFYLLPPAVLLWTQFGAEGHAEVVVVPVLVMAAGQLAGGLAWLTVSGEDAPDLIATAPIKSTHILRAKIEAVAGAVSILILPVIALIAIHSPRSALIALVTVMLTCAAATTIQLWFRAQAKRSLFRYRQTTSRIAALSEAGATIALAGMAGLWVYGSIAAFIPALLALLALLVARMLSPGSGEAKPATATSKTPVETALPA